MSAPRPPQDGRIDLEQQSKRAKALLRDVKAGNLDALRRLPATQRPTQLADAQRVIARDLGFTSWPKLKAHCDALRFALDHPDFVADDSEHTQHWRCGNDIQHSLQLAGFKGQLHMLSDPLCMGPMPRLGEQDYRAVRSAFISHAFDLDAGQVRQRMDDEYAALAQIGHAGPCVLWCEADAYDQLFLIRVLAGLDQLPDDLSLIAIGQVPGVERFIGIGQLAPQVLAWLWPQRRPVTAAMLSLARAAWDAFQTDDPRAWSVLAHGQHAALPLLAPALLRQLQELPALADGLSLTERLALQSLHASGPAPFGKVFADLTNRLEPLPYLGDLMFYGLMRPLIDARTPLLLEHHSHLPWPQRSLQLTDAGRQVLAGRAYGLDLLDQERWVGGIRLRPRQSHWALDSLLQPIWRGAPSDS